MNPTVELLQLLGSPFATATTIKLSQIEPTKLCDCSKKNRMLFLYLETMSKKHVDYYSTLYKQESVRYLQTDNAVARVSNALEDANMKHAVFKTIRPYKSTTVDLDILIFEKRNNFMKSVKAMQKAGYKLIARGPRSTTLWDEQTKIGIDLYQQVAVSYITYIDKQKLQTYITTTKLPNGKYVKTLKPEADLACIIAHSIMKEQMYTLSEYYTFIHYLKQMNINNFLNIVKQNNITTTTRTHTAITALLHKTAHNTTPEKLQQILNNLGQENFETTRLTKSRFKTPHKYHPITTARSLLEITKGKETRKSIATQISHTFDPKFSKDFLRRLITHTSRQTY